MYLLCSDWSIRSLEKEKEEKEKEKEENCHLLNTARRTDEGRDKNVKVIFIFQKLCRLSYFIWMGYKSGCIPKKNV